MEKASLSGDIFLKIYDNNELKFFNSFKISAECTPNARLKFVYDSKECFSHDNEHNPQICTFEVLYDETIFKPEVFLYEGDIEIFQIKSDFTLIPFNYSSIDITYYYNSDDSYIGCFKQPQTYQSMKSFGLQWNKSTYIPCYKNIINKYIYTSQNNLNESIPYEIMNFSSNNGMIFNGKEKDYYFQFTMLGQGDSFCETKGDIHIIVKNLPLKWWQVFLIVYSALIFLGNISIYIFWTTFKYNFCEFIVECKRRNQQGFQSFI